jgi:DNA-binding NarL/FixJ family response regulator
MKQISLFSSKRSVLSYWQKHIYKKYTVLVYDSLPELYKDLEKSQPDVILFDYNGDATIAEELLEYSESEKIDTYIMVLNSRPIFSEGVRLLGKDARAFMNAYAKPENLNQAIETVIKGNIWLYPEFIQAMIKESLFSHVEKSDMMQELSSRQREIAEMVALGMSNKEIAKHADITEQTVKTHLKAIYEKVGVHTRLELAIIINRIANSY